MKIITLMIHFFLNSTFNFELDSHLIVRDNTERFCVPLSQFPPILTCCNFNCSAVSQLGFQH